ncbi:hypothetical protein, conserved [Trypanosoma brucei brucei TREU927]|uniref:TRUD domain-containing protein n=1 Tax=Trypanosoma brucei brucei (strain 927/4 GUTat10.1) TaxID=185431 RepID=Q389B8_TRYB2|nr:hypothetical protein, conserved [Trypanosoma brucei brucei TREU927]EAN78602.1 hypothetical protein, conserved [Trypanosoma brucei brucei TREU927]
MGSPTPNVRRAMIAVSRRLKLRRPPRTPSAGAVARGSCIEQTSSHFVTAAVERLHSQVAPVTPTHASHMDSHKRDLPCLLRTFLDQGHAPQLSSSVVSCAVSSKQIIGKTAKSAGLARNDAEDMLMQYRPKIDSALVRRVACAMDVEGALRRARKLTQALREGGELDKMLSSCVSVSSQVTKQEMELQAGIAARFHQQARAKRQMKLRGFRLSTSDIQVSEVLPDGNIVTFTNPTLPSAAGTCSRKSSLDGKQLPYLYFVLYKENISLGDAFRLLSEVSEGMCRLEDFAVNVALEESAVTAQLCSVRIALLNDETHGIRRSAAVKKLLRVNLRPLRLSVQLIGWRDRPCEPASSGMSQAQYSMLIRGISANEPTHLERKVLARFTAFPNFFGPRHFGPFCLFRTYHAAAAWERGMHAEALVIGACLSYADSITSGSGWIGKLVEILRQGEDRLGVLKEWYQFNVPHRLRAQIASSKAALVWNVLASCRILELGACTMERSPDVGDFVVDGGRCPAQVEETVEKVELFPECGCGKWNSPPSVERKGRDCANTEVVKFISTQEDAAPYTIHNIVVPLGAETNGEVRGLLMQLGFRPTLHPVEHSQKPVGHRPLFATGSGYPRAASPWVKALPELTGGIAGDNGGVFRLLTDVEMRQSSSYTALSRGRMRGIWPVGKYGYRLTDRLPAGIVSLAASDATWRGTRCLAMHFTLPTQVYSMSLFREFVDIEDLTEVTDRVSSAGDNRKVEGSPPVRVNTASVEGKGMASDPGQGFVDGDLMGLKRRVSDAGATNAGK